MSLPRDHRCHRDRTRLRGLENMFQPNFPKCSAWPGKWGRHHSRRGANTPPVFRLFGGTDLEFLRDGRSFDLPNFYCRCLGPYATRRCFRLFAAPDLEISETRAGGERPPKHTGTGPRILRRSEYPNRPEAIRMSGSEVVFLGETLARTGVGPIDRTPTFASPRTPAERRPFPG